MTSFGFVRIDFLALSQTQNSRILFHCRSMRGQTAKYTLLWGKAHPAYLISLAQSTNQTVQHDDKPILAETSRRYSYIHFFPHYCNRFNNFQRSHCKDKNKCEIAIYMPPYLIYHSRCPWFIRAILSMAYVIVVIPMTDSTRGKAHPTPLRHLELVV